MTDDQQPVGTPAPDQPHSAPPPEAPPTDAAMQPGMPDLATPGPPMTEPPVVRRQSPTRWLIAAIVGVIVVALSAAGLFVLTGSSTASTLAAWAPADSVMYMELRADLPGDQRQNLARFLSHFPGFADQSRLDQKLDETLDRLIAKGSNGSHDWSKEIKPWFGGQIGVAVSQLGLAPSPSGGSPLPDGASGRYLLVVSQKDPAKAVAWFASVTGSPVTTESYKNVNLNEYTGASGQRFAVTALGGVLLGGDIESVKAAVDRNGSNGLAANQAFRDATAQISADQVGRMYIDFKRFFAMAMPNASSLPGFDQATLDRLPTWMEFAGRIEGDALVAHLVASRGTGAPKGTNRAETLAAKLPASTIVLVETHDLGTYITASLDQLRKNPATASALQQVDQSAALLGGLDKLLSWIGDTAIVVNADGGTPAGGIVINATDPSQANVVFGQLKSLVSLAGGSSGATVRDEPYGDGTITTIDLGDAAQLAGLLGSASGGSIPSLPISGRLELSYTVQRGLAIIGVGPGFVKSVLDVKPGVALADQARYRAVFDRIGSSNAGSTFIDLATIRKLAEPALANLPGAGSYNSDVKPYLAPFDILAAATTAGDTTDSFTSIITVTNP